MKHFALVALVMATACVAPAPESSDPGESPDTEDPTPSPPAPPPGGGGDNGTTACAQPATPPGSGRHNAGANCLGCHTGIGTAPLWTAAGTLYNAAGAAAVGATLTLVDANGKSISLVTAQNGNFWTSEALKMPLRVKASLCPTTVSMSATAGGACNSCHTATGSPGRIKLL
jgi:hypothetical protein